MTDPDRPDGYVDREEPETLRLSSLMVSLTADDLDASLSWYRDIVGFHVAETFERDGELRGVELVAGEAKIFLSQDDWGKGRDRQKGQGIRIYLQTSQAVDEVADAIRKRGGTLASEPSDMPWGDRAFELVDPDGFHLTISS